MIKCPFCGVSFKAKEAKMRSLPENRYYWGVVLEILSNETGYTPNEMHEVCRSMFLNENITLQKKERTEIINIPISTTSLKTVEFEEYLSKIRRMGKHRALHLYTIT